MSWWSKKVTKPVSKAVKNTFGANGIKGMLDPWGWVFKDEKGEETKPPVEVKEVETVEASVDSDSLVEDRKNRKKGFSSTIKSNAYGGFLGGAIGGGKSALGA